MKLMPFVPPPPAPKPVCAACKAFAPTFTLALDSGHVDLCVLCAHHHAEHGVALSACADARCQHTAAEIYGRAPAPGATAPARRERAARYARKASGVRAVAVDAADAETP